MTVDSFSYRPVGLFNVGCRLPRAKNGLSIASWLEANFFIFEVDELLLGVFPNGTLALDFNGLAGGPVGPF